MTKLNDLFLKNLKADDKPVTDSEVPGLIAVPKTTGVNWIFRFVSPTQKKADGSPRRREMGLGVYPQVTLKESRDKARDARKLVEDGKDPLEERDRQRTEAERESNKLTFGEAAKKVHADMKAGWKETKNVARWLANVEQHLAPILSRRVDSLTPRDFANALRAAWLTEPRATADALQRAGVIMRWCFAQDMVNADPTSLVRSLLPKQDTDVEHHPALPWRKAPAFMREHLSDIEPSDLKRAAAFVQILTACRPGEACGMRWSELDLEGHHEWVIPAARMKGKKDHHVPLVPQVVDLLKRMAEKKAHPEFVFPNARGTGPLPLERLQELHKKFKAPSNTTGRFATPHGFRSTFKDWSTNKGHDDRLSERALAHKVKGNVKQAYDRDNLFDPRVLLMREWADYLHTPANVVELPAQSAA